MAITNEPGISKRSMIVTPEKFLNLSEGLEGKPHISELPDDGEFNEVSEAITPAGLVASLWCAYRWSDEARSCPIVESFEGDARKLTGFPSAKSEHVVDKIHITSLACV
jgi:hypothetical protein